MAHNMQYHAKMCIFGVHTMAENIFGFKFPQNSQKWPSKATFKSR